MPIPARVAPRPQNIRHALGPRFERMDPAKPMFVQRRLSTVVETPVLDDAGQPVLGEDGKAVTKAEQGWLEPGTPFDPKSVSARKLHTLWNNRYISHQCNPVGPAAAPAGDPQGSTSAPPPDGKATPGDVVIAPSAQPSGGGKPNRRDRR